MDFNLVFSHLQYAVPVGVVLVTALLVFVFGFKKAEQPRFAQLSDAERKQAAKKRTKTRDKKNVNGHVLTEKASPTKKTSPIKNDGTKKTKSDENERLDKKHEDNKKSKNQDNKMNKENKMEQSKNKKNLKNLQHEKPVDFDEGDWEQAFSRKEKKNKKKEEEANIQNAKSKKSKKSDLIHEDAKESMDNIVKDNIKTVFNANNTDKTGEEKSDPIKTEIKDKSAKDTQNKELKEKKDLVVMLNRLSNDVIERHQSSKEKGVYKEEKVTKSKKGKKNEENVTIPSEVISSNVEVKTVPAKIVKEVETPAKENVKTENIEEKNKAAFDELGDMWTEAKPQRKNKKVRKDN